MSALPELIAFAGVMAVGQFSPGPDLLLVTRTALSDGTAAGVRTAAGIATGLIVHASLAVAGVSALFRAQGGLGKTVAWVGAAYLFWLAIGLVRKAGQVPEAGGARPGHAVYVRGLLCNLLNPKALLFLAAVSSPFLAGRSETWWPWAIAGVAVIQGFALWCGWAAVLQWPPVQRGYRRAAKWIDRVFAVMLAALAVGLLVEVGSLSGMAIR